jgi:signal transduction histidine kinase
MQTIARGRWTGIASFALAFGAYWLAIASGILTPRSTAALNDILWTIAGAITSVICFITAGKLRAREQLTWRLVGTGCALWTVGQMVWNYYDLVIGTLPDFPHWMQLFYSAFPLLLVSGLLVLPKPSGATRITVRHAGNLGLIVCAFGAILTISVVEPAAELTTRSFASVAFTLLHLLTYALACITALYLLWSYPWPTAYWSLALIAVGSGVHTATFIADLHSRFVGNYEASDWTNVAWLVSFACFGVAAYEYAQRSQLSAPPISATTLQMRERTLEATMPAILILAIILVAVLNVDFITVRVIYIWAALAAIFAAVLGVREAWNQREEQRLVAALNQSNQHLLTANSELRALEQSHRALNVELEQRVIERTQKLTQAYQEMENFSYAVAHDLKSPLRAIHGFGALLEDEYAKRLDHQGRVYIDRMRRGALTMATLVDDLLAYAHIDRSEPQVAPTHLGNLLRACVNEQRSGIERMGVSVTLEVDEVELKIDGDGLAIAIRNVLANAIKFTAGANSPTIALRAAYTPNRCHVSIADNGIGFDMQYHDVIFAMFQRLHRIDDYPGTGIGLALSRKAVERAGGRIWAESAPGAGATFHIELPAAA